MCNWEPGISAPSTLSGLGQFPSVVSPGLKSLAKGAICSSGVQGVGAQPVESNGLGQGYSFECVWGVEGLSVEKGMGVCGFKIDSGVKDSRLQKTLSLEYCGVKEINGSEAVFKGKLDVG